MAVHHYSCAWTHVQLALQWSWIVQKGRSQTYWNRMSIFSMMMEIDLLLRSNLLGSPTIRPVVPSSRIRKCRPWRIRQQSHPKGLQYSLKVWLQKRLDKYRYNVAAAVCVGYEDKTEKYKPSLRYKPGISPWYVNWLLRNHDLWKRVWKAMYYKIESYSWKADLGRKEKGIMWALYSHINEDTTFQKLFCSIIRQKHTINTIHYFSFCFSNLVFLNTFLQ